ncbi:MAG: hypothetical protein ABL925_10275 [Methylococcales bacterium]
MTNKSLLLPVICLPLLVACATIPDGPSVMVLPGSSKNFSEFQRDDNYCRQFAQGQLGDETANQAAINSGVGSALLGAGLGAAAGAAFGGGSGAAVGAGGGLIAGSIMGTETAAETGNISQQSYDNAYIQCMYGQGHRVPVQIDAFQGGGEGSLDLADAVIDLLLTSLTSNF